MLRRPRLAKWKGRIVLKPVLLILVGGFLGSGKTTLIRQAAQRLMRQGRRVGLITNDQASDLVDTEMLRREGFRVEEIAGGCFCCRFNDLVESSDRLVERLEADVLVGEPVGSCTDISATVLQPIKALLAARYNLSPFTVLIDPFRLQEVLDPRMNRFLHPSALYIVRKQLEEADLIAINKLDLLDADDLADLQARARELFPGIPQITLSALSGYGVDEWLSLVLQRQAESAGHHIADVDYDVYAEGEAVLGWLNATILLSSHVPTEWRIFLRALLENLKSAFAARSAEIAHVKALLSANGTQMVASLAGSNDSVVVRGDLNNPQKAVKLVLNARVETTPQDLAAAVEAVLKAAAADSIRWQVTEWQCLSPGRPQPTHRYTEVI